jgi:hypothetical protein
MQNDPLAVSSKVPTVRMNLVWVSRHTFEMTNKGKLTGHQQPRTLSDAEEAAIILGLQSLVLEWNKASCV